MTSTATDADAQAIIDETAERFRQIVEHVAGATDGMKFMLVVQREIPGKKKFVLTASDVPLADIGNLLDLVRNRIDSQMSTPGAGWLH